MESNQLKLLDDQENLERPVGTMYFNITLLAINGWYLTTSKEGSVVQSKEAPEWDEGNDSWNYLYAGPYSTIARVDLDGVMPEKTLARVVEWSRPEDKKVSFLEHTELVKRQALIIQAAVGRPIIEQTLSEKEYHKKLKTNKQNNEWNFFFKDVLPTLAASVLYGWSWVGNSKCKYTNLNVRIDMRDLGCVIRDRDNNHILPEAFSFQYDHAKRAERIEEKLNSFREE